MNIRLYVLFSIAVVSLADLQAAESDRYRLLPTTANLIQDVEVQATAVDTQNNERVEYEGIELERYLQIQEYRRTNSARVREIEQYIRGKKERARLILKLSECSEHLAHPSPSQGYQSDRINAKYKNIHKCHYVYETLKETRPIAYEIKAPSWRNACCGCCDSATDEQEVLSYMTTTKALIDRNIEEMRQEDSIDKLIALQLTSSITELQTMERVMPLPSAPLEPLKDNFFN